MSESPTERADRVDQMLELCRKHNRVSLAQLESCRNDLRTIADEYENLATAAVNLDQNTAGKLTALAIDMRHRANDYDTFSQEEAWQVRAGLLDRAADLLSEAARMLDAALVRDGGT